MKKAHIFPSLNFLRNLERIFLFLLISAAVAGCTSDDDLGDITGKYGKLTGETDTYIEITQLKDGYRMNCRYQEYLEDEQREEIYRWEGTFQNTPSDVVKDAQGKEIGNISFASGRLPSRQLPSARVLTKPIKTNWPTCPAAAKHRNKRASASLRKVKAL